MEFYAPWCGHCKNLAPEWEIAGNLFQPQDDIIIAAFDATTDESIASRHNVQGYPTIKFFPKDAQNPEEYQGGRQAEDIVKWVNNRIGTNRKLKSEPTAVTTLTVDNFDSKALGSKAALVEFYAPWCGHCKQLTPKYEQLAVAFAGDKDVLIAKVDATEEPELGKKYEVAGFPTIKFFPAGSSDAEDYDGSRELDDFVEFINKKVGTQRNKDGSLAISAGTVKVLNDIIAARKGVIDEAFLDAITAASSNFDKNSQDFISSKQYITITKKVLDKGNSYIVNELTRLGKIISSDNVLPVKRTNFQLKHNVLSAFHRVAVDNSPKEL